jgi:hypothetical protein
MRKRGTSATWTLLSATDPCALWGVVLPAPKIGRQPGNLVIVRAGEPILTLEGDRILFLAEVSDEELAEAVDILVRERQGRKLVIERWNGEPIAASTGWNLLADAGFHTDGERLIYDGLPGPTARLRSEV